MLGGTQSEAPLITPQQQQEQEALKRNTDCVYFLASPLTCKKGIECEYRHSDIARLNPRDCWYWLNGNCLNPKCAFRHPPLVIEVTTPAVNSLPPSQTVVPVASQGPNVPGKQVVPCIFFQQGYCLKGDMCPFMHPPYSLNNKAIQSAGATPISESQTNKKTFGGLGKHTQEQKVSQANPPKSADLPPHMKSIAVVGKAPLRNEISISRNEPIAVGLDDELPRYSRGNVHLSSNGNLVSRSKRNSQVHTLHTLQDQSILNVKDADEVSREPSPGFDVLVDDEIRDSEYYHDADQYGRTGHDGMNFTAANEYDIGRSADYGSVGGVDLDMYCDSRNYDSFERLQGQYDSSERMLRGSAHLERRLYPRADSPGGIDGSDLRHHLSKQKRNNGLRSVISRDSSRENHADGRNSRASRREQLPVHEASSRLRGRIKIPGRSMSPIDRINPHIEREIDRSRHLRRLSPERPLGKLRDRIKGRVQEDFDNERNFRGSSARRDIIYDNSAEFSGPKSLSELKVRKTSESSEQHMNDRPLHGKRKYPQMEEVKQGEGDVSFEGPKPLSEILKRKRGGDVAIHESGSTNDRENSEKEGKESMKIPTEAKELKYAFSSEANNKVNQGLINEGSEAGEVGVAEENNKSYDGQSSLQCNATELQIEKGMIGDEAYDQRRGDFDYDEQADGEDYINIDEGENADPEDDYFDEDDDADDFAKKMGAMYS